MIGSWAWVGVLAAGSLLLTGCPDRSDAPDILQDGKRGIGADWTGAMYKASGGPACRWHIDLNKTGATVAKGSGDRSQSFTVYSAWAGKTTLFSDRCGPWRLG
jgi:hypothetical protein